MLLKPGFWSNFIAAAGIAFIAGCGGSGSGGATQSGVLLDAPVEGVEYLGNNGTTQLTGSGGSFDYTPGEAVTFKIGGVVLGSAAGGATITPVHLAGDADINVPSAKAVKILQFLQSLHDSSAGDIGNGIKITKEVRDALKDEKIDFGTATDATLLAAIAKAGKKSVVPVEDAKDHYFATLEARGMVKTAKNIIFFLGDGMGIPTMTAARIFSVGEDGQLTMDGLPYAGFVRTYSNNAQTTDSAPSMSAYMTGVKMNNDVIAMTQDTLLVSVPNVDALNANPCGAANGQPVTTILELAKAAGLGTGVVTTTRVTHATPAATYAHICNRDLENDIAAQLTPGGTGFNTKLGDGVDVVLGGGSNNFLPTAAGGKRQDGRNLASELKAKGYTYVTNKTEFDAAAAGSTSKLLGLFTKSHMTYEQERDAAREPSLAEMTAKAIDVLSKNKRGFFLMVEGGRIDHALHETTAIRALKDTIAFDDAIRAALDRMKAVDPDLRNTLIVVTADHDHTLVMNGYAKRTGRTTSSNPGVLGLVKNVVSGANELDAEGMPYSILGFGNGENRVAGGRNTAGALTDAVTSAATYHQEAAVKMGAGGETHGSTDVWVGAIGAGATMFSGFMDNTEIFGRMRKASGL